jgi:hypothetical protein
LGGIIGCYCVYKRSKREKDVRIRALSGVVVNPYISHDFKGMPVAIKQEALKIEDADRLSAGYRKANIEDEGQPILEEEQKDDEFVVDMI